MIGYRFIVPRHREHCAPASLTGTTYIDTVVLAGVNYTYMVTALQRLRRGSPVQHHRPEHKGAGLAQRGRSRRTVFQLGHRRECQLSLLWNVPSDTGDGAITGYNIYRARVRYPHSAGVGPGRHHLLRGRNGRLRHHLLLLVSALNQWGESEPSRMLSASLITLAVPGEVDVDVEEGQGRITLSCRYLTRVPRRSSSTASTGAGRPATGSS